MKLTIMLAVLLSSAPAQACHRFSHWAYPWPQNCGRATGVAHRAAEDKTWYVEFTRLPPDDELNQLLAHVHDPDSEYSQQQTKEKEGN